MPLTIKQISEALKISRSRVEMWISRGYFVTPDKPMLGMAREWDITDAVRLAIMSDLIEAGVPAQQAGNLVTVAPATMSDFGLVPFVTPFAIRSEPAFFVAWQGWHEMAGGGKAHMPGNWYSETVWAHDLAGFVGGPDIDFATVININSVIARVTAALQTVEG